MQGMTRSSCCDHHVSDMALVCFNSTSYFIHKDDDTNSILREEEKRKEKGERERERERERKRERRRGGRGG